MVNISESGEEGYYPDLQKTAEERLRSLSPNNRHLRVEEPVLTRNSMNSDEWNNIMSDVASWKKEISVRDLRLTEENNNTMDEVELPPVRQLPPPKAPVEKKAADNSACTTKRVSDYAAWDKYDVDTELLKMDLEEEREKEERQRERKQTETDRLEQVIKDAEKLSETERQVLAQQEKDRGNEYYQAKDYNEAIKYYTASIAIWPTAKAYNNRAACYLKQCMYSAALKDANSTLELEPNNIKALFRRGISYQHKNMFREALADMKAVLRQQPKHLLAQHISKELREQILTMPRTIRLMNDPGVSKPKTIIETTEDALTKDSLSDSCYEVNEWGLAKIMCQCNGTPRFLQLANRKCPTTHLQPRQLPAVNNARIVELSDEPEPPKPSTKLEIIEVEESLPTRPTEPVEDYFKPVKKCVVVDKRTEKTASSSSTTSGKLASENSDSNLTIWDSSSSLSNGDTGMDEDFELNCPLLSEPSEPVLEPSV